MVPEPYIVRRIWAIFLILQSQIICIKGDCGPPPVIEHTQSVAATSGVPGDTVNYLCDRTTGYYEIPNKGRTITCQDDNTWSAVTEFCARACGVPERLNFAVPRDSDLERDIFLPGTNVTYNCRPGYRRSPGSINVITCLDNYTWSTPSQFCVPRSCGHPQDADNGEFEATNAFLFGSRVTYTCNDGYRLASRRHYRDCQADGTWSNAVPQCEVVLCPAPDNPAGGTYNPVKDEYTYQEAVTFTCNRGLHISGESTASCTRDGTWSRSFPSCIAVNCEDPGQIENGGRTSGFAGPYTLNSAVSYQCDRNFVMNGSSTITCTANNKWSSEIPKCLTVSCGDPGDVRNAERSGLKFTFGSRVTYRCHDGYKITSSIDYKICQADGTWSPEIICSVTCQIPIVDHSISGRKDVYVQGEVVMFKCKHGFVLNGSSSITCNSRGQWEPSPPKCNATCPIPEIANSILVHRKSTYVHGDVLEYRCEEGYGLSGSSTIKCNHVGQWASSKPECKSLGNEGLGIGAIVGIIIGSLLAAGVVCLLSWWFLKNKTGEYYCEHKNDLFKPTVEQELIESINTKQETQI